MGRKPRWIEELESERERRKLLNRLRQLSDDVHPYTVLHPRGMDGHDLINSGKDFASLPATRPIKHPPWSPERIEELKQRVGRCEDLWHQDDVNTFDGVTQWTPSRIRN